MKFEANLQLARIDLAKWNRQLNQELKFQFELAVIAWLNAATAPIPAWSGASLGTFSDLAARVNFVLSIQPTNTGARLGLGREAGEAASTGKIDVDQKRGIYTAEYSTSLKHLIFNEFNNANAGGDPAVFSRLRNPGPYGFIPKANTAFLRVAEKTKIPAPTFKIKTRRV